MRSRRALQLLTGVLGLVPLLTGLVGLSGLRDPLYALQPEFSNVLLDSNLRFFAGVWFAVGCAVLWLIPGIERETTLFRFLWLMIFVGGIGRLLSIFLAGLPPAPFIGFTVLEVVGAPIFVFWQSRVAAAGNE